MGAGVGSSLDFQDHRNYVPGDDPRHINWQAFARTGNYSMKLYREEVRPLVDVIFDVSASMFFEPGKEHRALELFYFCAETAVRGSAAVTFFLVRANQHVRLNEEAVFGHGWQKQAEAALRPDVPAHPPDVASLPLRANAMRIFISDLLYPVSPGAITSALSSRKGRGIVFAPSCDAESRPKWDGNYEFIDAEDRSHHLNRIEPPLLKRYLEAYRRHFELWKTYAAKHGVILSRIPSETAFDRALQQEAIPQGAVELI